MFTKSWVGKYVIITKKHSGVFEVMKQFCILIVMMLQKSMHGLKFIDLHTKK